MKQWCPLYVFPFFGCKLSTQFIQLNWKYMPSYVVQNAGRVILFASVGFTYVTQVAYNIVH